MDVWFDSGSSHAYVLREGGKWDENAKWPADLYLEGSDQFRGWFQSSLLTGVAALGAAPYKTVVSCGWVVDGEGKKMSKSLGNGIAPEEIIKEYGADIVRLWVAASDYQVDVRISKDILKQLSEAYRKIRNTARFIIGNISDFCPNTDAVKYEDLTDLDKWALSELSELVSIANEAYQNFDFHKVYHNIHRFCVISMSNFYLDIIKDRLYITQKNGKLRRAAQTVMFEVLKNLTQILAPVLAFTTQEIWGYIPNFEGKKEYVVLHDIENIERYKLNESDSDKWNKIIAVSADVKKVLENARAEKQIGSSLEAKVILHCEDEKLFAFLDGIKGELPDIFIVSQVLVLNSAGGAKGEYEALGVEALHADGEKCARCWQYSQTVGENTKHPQLCKRCAEIIEE
jgi:isoleucyl-tRNA synthetase